jgi:hypothetical protein
MRKRGIKCAKQEELELLHAQKKMPGRAGHDGTACDGNYSDACASCGLYNKE